MNPATLLLLSHLGFDCQGLDPAALDHHLYAPPAMVISVPASGCSAPDLARLIFHAGAAAARREIRRTHDAFIAAIKL